MTLVLGIHRDPFHNTGAAILRDDGKDVSVVAISEERLDRIKDSSRFPSKAISYCLDAVGAEHISDCDLIVADYIFEKDWSSDRDENIIARISSLKDRFIRRKSGHEISADKVTFVNHHLAHAYTAYYGAGFDDAAILVVDGHGSIINKNSTLKEFESSDRFETQSLYETDKFGEIQLVERSTLPGIGRFYQAFTKVLGFGELQEGKTMGLAPYGNSNADLGIDFSPSIRGMSTDYSDVLVALKGPLAKKIPPVRDLRDQTNAFYSRLAFDVQQQAEASMLYLAEYASRITGKRKLCLAGGVALNSVANQAVATRGVFSDVWIQPASSDTGIPLGCALYGYYSVLKGKRKWKMSNAYLGAKYSVEKIEGAITKFKENIHVEKDLTYSRTAQLLADGKIVGWFCGGSEYGPRALGHRSILMDPRSQENKDILNHKVKHREPFRPFGPSVLQEKAKDYFNLEGESPFMLLVPDVRPEKRSEIPAVTHVDGTARVQTVTRKDNGRYYELIRAFYELTGTPVLLNTSFNVAGEPIVETPEDAIRSFLTNNIDVLVIEDHVLTKK